MIKRSVKLHPAYKIFTTTMRNQLFISAALTKSDADPVCTAADIYNHITAQITASASQIVQERCFGNVELQPQILEVRSQALRKNGLDSNTPITFIEGESCLENKLAGIQIRAIQSSFDTRIRTITERGIPKGRAWNLNGSTFFILQNLDGGQHNSSATTAVRKSQSQAMFQQAEQLLRNEGAGYQDVVRTWIYIDDILDWYHDFNLVRNDCYSEYGFIRNDDAIAAEQLYLPASTGIEGRNPAKLPAVMDVFAVRRSPTSAIQIRPIYGSQQRSPYRYGSAFSRAIVVEEPGSKLILVSGTASIDEQGKSVFVGDVAAQIKQTLNVVSTLIAAEGATLQDLCEATIFLKHRQDYPAFLKIAEQMGIADAPFVNAIADVCRDELLFELDAAFILEKDQA